ncbi:MAG: glycine cleavage system protein GcvH [Proteobacteria bacterium]|nr:glycine cleavage system protein GcvH [Pseudomonadota bacterium]
METRDDLHYTKEHEWILMEGEIATIGITDFAQNNLGDVVYVELPEVGSEVDSGDSIGNIESVKAVADLYSPFNGEITEVNTDLEEKPETVNSSPYDDGWMFKIRLRADDAGDTEILDASAYTELAE